MRRARVAGTDTREAMATPTVRAAVASSALVCAPAWAATFWLPDAWETHFQITPSLAPWCMLAVAFAGVAIAIVSVRVAPLPSRAAPGVLPCVAAAIISLFAVTRSDRSLALVLPVAVFIAGWVVGQAARRALAVCAQHVHSAALGTICAGAIVGLIGGGHLSLVAKGSGAHRAAVWAAVYFSLALVNLARADRRIAHDASVMTGRYSADVPEVHGPVFVLDRIHVSFHDNHVLHGATLSTYPGELVALVGGNGAGKSTLLRVAAGLVTADRGSVIVGNDEITSLLPEERAAAGLAFISGARPVFPDLTVTENLRVAAFRSHLTADAFEEATEAVFEIVPALAARRRTRAGVLSGGEQRLLAVAQMLYRRPTVLLADELSLGLDADARVAVLDLLRVLADQGVSAVVVDHDLPTLLSRATRAVLLSAGGIEEYAKPEELLTRRADLLPATFLAGANG